MKDRGITITFKINTISKRPFNTETLLNIADSLVYRANDKFQPPQPVFLS